MAHSDPEQIQCREAFGGPQGVKLTRLMALDFWKSPAALHEQLRAWGSAPTCTVSTFLLEQVTSLSGGGGGSPAPGPRSSHPRLWHPLHLHAYQPQLLGCQRPRPG